MEMSPRAVATRRAESSLLMSPAWPRYTRDGARSMAIETEPVWVDELRAALAQDYTPEERVRLRAWASRLEHLNRGGGTWRPGTFQRLLEQAGAEDAGLGV